MSPSQRTLLLVANYDSGVGYAWWLMESFWVALANHYCSQNQVILAYPMISKLPPAIRLAPLLALEQDFNDTRLRAVYRQCRFLHHYKVRTVYFTDQHTLHWRYGLYRFYGVKSIIVHDHTPGLRTTARGPKAWLKWLVHRLPWFGADGVIGATEFVRQRLVKVNCVPPSKCYTAANGLPDQDYLPKALDIHSIFQIPAERKILVMCSRADRYKRVDFVLRCIAHLCTATVKKNIHFLFIGDGPDLVNLSSMATNTGINDCCTFAGRRDDDPAILEGADIAIHPSRGEVGYSLSILEYMRAGLPVVVPDNPSVNAATVHMLSGMIYPEEDVESASKILQQLANDDTLRYRLGSEAKKAMKQYKLELTHRALLDAFAKIDQKRSYAQ